MTAVAATLGTTERTLRRTLASTGASFRLLVDEARRDRALELLSATPGSVTRVAFDTGFSDTSAFTHACQRWFGRPPREVARDATLRRPRGR
jgi:AraC-like DNA-binding protein